MKAKSSTPAPTPGAYCQRLGAQSLVFPCKPSLPAGETRRHAEHHRSHSLATGSEVHLALAAQEILATQKISVRVVSMPCCELFDEQAKEYREIGARVAVEAGATLAWARYIGLDGEVVGLDRFGASAPQAVLYREFGIPAEAVADTARRVLFRAKGIATQHSWEQPQRSASN